MPPLYSDEYEGLQRSPLRYGMGAPRAGGPFKSGAKPIAQAPDSLAPDDETLVPAPSVTGVAHGPGGTGGTPARRPGQPYAAPFLGNQDEIDFQAERAIQNRYMTRLQDVKAEHDLIGDPIDRDIQARVKARAQEDLMPAGTRPSLRATLRPGGDLEEVDYNTPPPVAPTVGEVRRRREQGASVSSNPQVVVQQMKNEAADADQSAADNEINQYRQAIEMIRRDGRGNAEGRIQLATNILNAKLAKLGVRAPTQVDPLRVPSIGQ